MHETVERSQIRQPLRSLNKSFEFSLRLNLRIKTFNTEFIYCRSFRSSSILASFLL